MGLLPRMAEVLLRDPRRLGVDPRFACMILGLLRKSSDPTFAQQNSRLVRIRTMRIQMIHVMSAYFIAIPVPMHYMQNYYFKHYYFGFRVEPLLRIP